LEIYGVSMSQMGKSQKFRQHVYEKVCDVSTWETFGTSDSKLLGNICVSR